MYIYTHKNICIMYSCTKCVYGIVYEYLYACICMLVTFICICIQS